MLNSISTDYLVCKVAVMNLVSYSFYIKMANNNMWTCLIIIINTANSKKKNSCRSAL